MWRFERYPAPFDDEGTYVSQAWALQSESELSHYTYWYDHPPLGWIQLAAWTAATDGFDRFHSGVAAGREAMVFVHLIALVLLYVLARRLLMSRPAALATVAVFTFSPLAWHFHRMVLLDNLAVPWMLATFVLLHSPNRSLRAYVSAAACFAVAILTKETILLLLPAVALEFWQNVDRRMRGYALALSIVVFSGIVAMYPIFAWLKGELLPGSAQVSLWEGIRFQLFERQSTGSIVDPQSLSRQTLEHWLTLDEWLLVAGLLVTPVVAIFRHLRGVAAALLIMALASLRDGYLPSMFVVAAIPFMSLAIVGLIDAAARAIKSYVPRRHANVSRLRRIVERAVSVATVSAALGIGSMVVLPDWIADLRLRLGHDAEAPFRAARSWTLTNVPRDTPILVGNSLWIDLILSGFERESVVWYWKPDLDPAVSDMFPRGWRDFRYILSTPDMRSASDTLPTVELALRNSRVLTAFGPATNRVEVREIVLPPREERQCIDGWRSPLPGSHLHRFALRLIRTSAHVAGPLLVDDIRYFVGPESPASNVLPEVERWYVNVRTPNEPVPGGRFLIERRHYWSGDAAGSGIVAVAPYGTYGFRSPDWVGFQLEVESPRRVRHVGLPGAWSGTPYDFVAGGAGLTVDGLPAVVAGCLDGT